MSSGYPDFYRLIEFGAQRIGVAIKGEWEIVAGRQKTLIGTAFGLAGGASTTVISYPVPDGKQLYITAMAFISRGPDFPPAMYHVYMDGTLLMAGTTSSGNTSIYPFFIAPFRVDSGYLVRGIIWNEGAVAADFYLVLHGYEVSA